jgi:hypothetical protein
VKDTTHRVEGTIGELAVHLVNEKLTAATEDVLKKLSLDELAEMASKGGDPQQAMYYI